MEYSKLTIFMPRTSGIIRCLLLDRVVRYLKGLVSSILHLCVCFSKTYIDTIDFDHTVRVYIEKQILVRCNTGVKHTSCESHYCWIHQIRFLSSNI